MYKRILVTTRNQPWEDAAVDYAIALAADTGATLSILTVLKPPVVAGMPDITACSGMLFESVVAQSQTFLGAAAAAAEQAGVPYRTYIRWGKAAETILHSASADDCDLIILGTRPSFWRQRRFQDYTSRQVALQAQQPVLLVSQAPTSHTTLWSSLLVIRDHSPYGEAAEEYAYHLAAETYCEVAVVSLEAVQERLYTTYLNSLAFLDQPCHWPVPAAEMLTEQLSATHPGNSSLLQTVTSTACDVILLGLHQDTGWKRWLWGQPAPRLLAATHCPVLLCKPWYGAPEF